MSIYISLVSYTQQGISKIKDSPARMDAAKKGRGISGREGPWLVPDDGPV